MKKTRGRSRFRRVLIVLASVVGVLAVVVGGGFTWLWTGADISTVGKVRFDHEMKVPPLAESTVRKDGTRVFDLRMQAGETEFKDGKKTPTWGFNGSYLGPTLRAARGEKVEVRVRNSLDEASSVHWHGMHLPAVMDGGPHQAVAPGARWNPYWKIDQPAATLWYHPHPHGETEQHVARGLAGMFLIDDAKSAQLALPKRYGVDDLPVIVQDVNFDGAKLDHGHQFLRNVGFLGKQTMVNGTLDPYKEVGDRLVRLRLLNASTARIYTFGFDDSRQFSLVGTDGGLLEQPAGMKRIQLSPGERAEIVVEMKAGERTVLRSSPWQEGGAWEKRFNGGDDSFDVLQLRAAKTLRDSPALPTRLVASELPAAKDAVRGRYFELKRSGINGKKMDMGRVDETVTRGTTEVWTLHNGGDMTHNFHVHDVQFRVLSVDGKPPEAALRGPKDTIAMPLGATVKIALRFDGPADPDHPYMFHCHLLDHEDHGMMGQFVVVEKGQKAGAVGGHTGH
ncbi:multicopper oxidase domain-containing protein [Streptomyces sp. NPDC050738]|uniref:multicopper oxidase family protein n=1 Tax=Streptomyces sp. NPDC050738 TaxID=3154744 RepID=UPI003416E9BB